MKMDEAMQQFAERFRKVSKPKRFEIAGSFIEAHTEADAETVFYAREHVKTAPKLCGVALILAFASFASFAGTLEVTLAGLPPLRLSRDVSEGSEGLRVQIQSAANIEFTAPAAGADQAFFRLRATELPAPTPPLPRSPVPLPSPQWFFAVRDLEAQTTHLTWAPVEGALEYIVRIGVGGDVLDSQMLGRTFATEWTDARIVDGLTYYVTPNCWSCCGAGWPTNAAEVTTP